MPGVPPDVAVALLLSPTPPEPPLEPLNPLLPI
jgi:hypothetical protein